ncbi:hypothetical protein B0T21DRAFT_129125 [Apiosordaria backusii]|uniref:Uncharacterized protein n=1 Tax=Apiosordaria backusii TaxID=314023 RepID=A0AA40K1F0_9PEZI|nr:hypothetical protein B0T21DRAFT_129125 [Apiosordaria backusii]
MFCPMNERGEHWESRRGPFTPQPSEKKIMLVRGRGKADPSSRTSYCSPWNVQATSSLDRALFRLSTRRRIDIPQAGNSIAYLHTHTLALLRSVFFDGDIWACVRAAYLLQLYRDNYTTETERPNACERPCHATFFFRCYSPWATGSDQLIFVPGSIWGGPLSRPINRSKKSTGLARREKEMPAGKILHPSSPEELMLDTARQETRLIDPLPVKETLFVFHARLPRQATSRPCNPTNHRLK